MTNGGITTWGIREWGLAIALLGCGGVFGLFGAVITVAGKLDEGVLAKTIAEENKEFLTNQIISGQYASPLVRQHEATISKVVDAVEKNQQAIQEIILVDRTRTLRNERAIEKLNEALDQKLDKIIQALPGPHSRSEQ